MMKYFFIFCIFCFLFSCNVQYKIAKQTKQILLKDTALLNTNIGITIFDPIANKYLYNFNGNKYFVPASNTKILTCYAAMKYLSDSLVGLQYQENDTALFIQGTGDPSFLLVEYKNQPVESFLQKTNKKIILINNNWQEERWGNGWNWTDFNTDYCQERSVLPMYYNTVNWKIKNQGSYINQSTVEATPIAFNQKLDVKDFNIKNGLSINVQIQKELHSNEYKLISSLQKFQSQSIPFTTSDTTTQFLLGYLLKKNIQINKSKLTIENIKYKTIKTQPTDSLLKPMMHRSDNFFAEQSILMVSNEKLGYMNDAAIIEYVKKNDFIGIPQMPSWVDGSGLSRYNMFTPQSIVWVLNKMKNEFGMTRIKNIFATGGEGTISNYYKNIAGSIFAKTGTLSNHAAFSGFLYTKKGKLLIFSTLTSGWQGSATPVRKAVEKYLVNLYNNY